MLIRPKFVIQKMFLRRIVHTLEWRRLGKRSMCSERLSMIFSSVRKRDFFSGSSREIVTLLEIVNQETNSKSRLGMRCRWSRLDKLSYENIFLLNNCSKRGFETSQKPIRWWNENSSRFLYDLNVFVFDRTIESFSVDLDEIFHWYFSS